MTVETIIWRPQRTRVFADSMQNPWSRDGSHARANRELVRGLSADRPEEDEDYDTWAPPRPTRSYCPVPSDPVQAWRWFDKALADQVAKVSVEEHGEFLPEEIQARSDALRDMQAAFEREKEHARYLEVQSEKRKAHVFHVRLEDNVEELGALDDLVIRGGLEGCWGLARSPYYSRLDRNPGQRSVSTTEGRRRSMPVIRLIYVIEHGEISNKTILSRDPSHRTWCVNPEHYKITEAK